MRGGCFWGVCLGRHICPMECLGLVDGLLWAGVLGRQSASPRQVVSRIGRTDLPCSIHCTVRFCKTTAGARSPWQSHGRGQMIQLVVSWSQMADELSSLKAPDDHEPITGIISSYMQLQSIYKPNSLGCLLLIHPHQNIGDRVIGICTRTTTQASSLPTP